ncbi:MAG: aldo/keto reductase [Brevinematia bacterium]
MNYRKLGSSDLDVSVVGYGGWEIGWKGYDLSELELTIVRAFELGVNFFDTAPVYGFGKSEEVIGKILKPFKDKVILATKVGLRWDETGRIYNNLKRDSIMYEVEMSLKRLGTDRIDLYQVHWPDPNTPISETFSTLRKLLDENIVKYVGVSNFGPNLIEEALDYCPIVSNQIVYNYFQRGIEREVVPYCKGKNISIIAYSPLCQGLSIGKYNESSTFEEGDPRLLNPSFGLRDRFLRNIARSKEIVKIAQKKNISPSQLALAWVLFDDIVASALVGTTKVSHLEDNVKSSDIQLDEDTKREIDSVVSDPELFS